MTIPHPAFGLILLGLLSPGIAGAVFDQPLTLPEAERLATEIDPTGKRFQALVQAREEAAVAAGQWPDPQLITRLMNVPTDNLSVTDEAMTQFQIGLRQTFPRGQTRHLESARERARAAITRAEGEDWARLLRKTVRERYIEAHDHHAVLQVLDATRDEFDRLLDITERQYAVGTGAPDDVTRARLERGMLDDRIAARQEGLDTARAELSRWIGEQAAQRPLPEGRPEITPGPATGEPPRHPLLQAREAEIRAERHQVELAREAYKPQWSVELSYGVRGGGHPDNLSGMVMLDLPLFTGQRQDRRLAERQQELYAAQQDLADRQRELASRRHTAERREHHLNRRLEAFRTRFIADAENHAETALRSYQEGLTPFNTVIRAQLQVLETRLEALSLETEHARNQVERAYLAGGEGGDQ